MSFAKEELGFTSYDSDELLRLRIGQRIGVSAEEILLLEKDDTSIIYAVLEKDVAGIIDAEEAEAPESKEDDDAQEALIVRVWRQVALRWPNLVLYNFVAVWYGLYLESAQEDLRRGLATSELVREVRALYNEIMNTPGPFLNLNLLNDHYNQYADARDADVQVKDRERLVLENDVVASLNALTPAVVSTLEYEAVTTLLTVESELEPLHTFDRLRLDATIPFAHYQDDTHTFYRLYKGVELEAAPPLNTAWLRAKAELNTIAMRVFVGGEAIESNYTQALYRWGRRSGSDFQTIELAIPFKFGFDQDAAQAALVARIPQMRILESIDTDIRGGIKLRDFRFREDVLADLVMNDPIFRRYIYIRETSLVTITNRHPTYNMILPAGGALSFVFDNRESRINEPFLHLDGSSELLHERTPYTAITFKASDQAAIDSLLRIIPLLATRYSQQEAIIIEEYMRFIPSFDQYDQEQAPASAVLKTNIKTLENIAPEIFGDKYARVCQTEKRQPRIITEAEVAGWQNNKIMYRGELQERQIMRFPIHGEAQQRLYVCPGELNPFPGLVENERGSNREKFPYLPCCFGSNERDSSNNAYARYYRDEEPSIAAEVVNNNLLETPKFARVGQYGTLPRNIGFLLTHATVELDGNWYRTGTIISPNSLLHVIGRLYDGTYPLNGEASDAEAFVRQNLRPYIRDQVRPAVVKQELAGLTDESITALLTDGNSHFDSRLLYRVIEAAYGINLVVFVTTEAEPLGTFERAASSGIALRPYLNPELDTVMVYKHLGGEANAAQYPQYELIVHNDPKTGERQQFAPSEVVELISDALAATSSATNWLFTPDNELRTDPQANVVLDLEDLFELEQVSGQVIDAHGKLRAFLYSGVVVVPPLNRPFNVQEVEVDALVAVPIERVFALVNDLRNRGIDAAVYAINTTPQEKKVIGVWWQIGAPTPKSLFFSPCSEAPFQPEYEQIYSDYLPVPTIIPVAKVAANRYSHLQKVSYILRELLEYLFLLDLTTDQPHSPEEFLARYSVVRANHQYDMTNLERYFPVATTPEEALATLTAPTFIVNGAVVLDSDILLQHFTSHLEVLVNRLEGSVPEIPKGLRNFYRTAADFTPQAGTVVFDSFPRARDWVELFHQEGLSSEVTLRVTPEHQLASNPYVLRLGDYYYLVQNVLDGNVARALTVAQEWQATGVNKGKAAPATGQGAFHTYLVANDGSVGSPPYEEGAKLLRYADGHYAALLPLLDA